MSEFWSLKLSSSRLSNGVDDTSAIQKSDSNRDVVFENPWSLETRKRPMTRFVVGALVKNRAFRQKLKGGLAPSTVPRVLREPLSEAIEGAKGS